jgi:2-iminoacetate synthase ThiH
MCASLAAVPAAMKDMVRETVRCVALHRADAVVTIYHQCYRELVGLEPHANIRTFNYIHLLAQSMGLPYEDEYKAWKKAGAGAAAAIGDKRLEQVGVQFFERAMLPELVKRPPGLTKDEG